MVTPKFEIRALTESDIAAALTLCRDAGWNQLEADWLRLVRYQPDGCFVAVTDGQLVGTVTTTRYDSSLAWIGMMLVDPEFRRRGIASELMNASIQHLKKLGTQCIKLDATPVGQHVYEKLGFEIEWVFHRWQRDSVEGSAESPLHQELKPHHFELDRRAFGVDRSRWLLQLMRDSFTATTATGFGMLRGGHLATYLGPVVGSNPHEVAQIIRSLVSKASGPMFWDIPQANHDAVQLAQSLGFQPVRELTRMRLGVRACTPQLDLQYAICDPGTG